MPSAAATLRFPVDLWQPAHASRWRKGPRPRRQIDHILIHATSGRGDSRATAARWAAAPDPDEEATCAQLVIGQDAWTVQAVRLDDIAEHAHAASRTSIGIELCAREPGELGPTDPGLPPSPVQLARCARAIAWICRDRLLPVTRAVVLGHAEADPRTTHRGCPTAAGVDLDALVAMAVLL